MGFTNDSTKQVSINTKGVAQNTYDAIVIGSGISGGWAAKELCELGLKTLVLERGRNVEHVKDYPTANTDLWNFKHHNIMLPKQTLDDNPIVSRCYAFTEATEHFFVKDKEHPYVQDKPFDWIRGYQVGGKSLIWGRWVQRWSDLDFEANAKDGHGVDWPIRYKDIQPWYSYVEKFVGISGNKDGIPHLPDGEFMPPMELNALEKHLQNSIKQNYTDRQLITSRTANITKELPGRSACQYRNMCARGCPFGAYFSSNSSTLPAAKATGNLTLQPFAVVHSIIYDEQKGKATGVRVIDAKTKKEIEYFAKIIFINGGTLNTTLLLLNSTSNRFPKGFGNDSGALGHYLMHHNYRGKIGGRFTGLQDSYYYGRKPTGVYVPRFRNVGKNKRTDFIRGYAIAGGGNRATGIPDNNNALGAAYKQGLSEAGDWFMWMNAMGECLPYEDNKVWLDNDKKDEWGMPLLHIGSDYKENEAAMLKDALAEASAMLEKGGFVDVYAYDTKQAPGLDIHEMGTARMGKDAKTSVLNGNNQVWASPNVFVTDGACMASSACQNPSLTYMALTARAAHFAVDELKRRNL